MLVEVGTLTFLKVSKHILGERSGLSVEDRCDYEKLYVTEISLLLINDLYVVFYNQFYLYTRRFEKHLEYPGPISNI